MLFADVTLVRRERLSSVYFIALPQGHFLNDAYNFDFGEIKFLGRR